MLKAIKVSKIRNQISYRIYFSNGYSKVFLPGNFVKRLPQFKKFFEAPKKDLLKIKIICNGTTIEWLALDIFIEVIDLFRHGKFPKKNGGVEIIKINPEITPFFEYQILGDPKSNIKYYLKLKNRSIEPILKVYSEALLYTTGQVSYVLDLEQKKITYYMQWNIRKIKGHLAAYQIFVWSDIGTPEIRGLAAKLFFTILFSIYDVIVIDNFHGSQRKRFWQNIIATALEQGNYAYIVDLLGKVEPINVKSLQEIEEKKSYIWPENQIGQIRLLCLTEDELW